MDDIIITVDVDLIDIVITVSTGEGDFMLTSGTNSDIDYLDFDMTPATAVNAPGRLWWNEAAKTLSLGLLNGGSYEFGNSTAASTSFAPYKSISASNVQRAIEELIDENVDYLLKYVVPSDVSSINLTTDQYGNAFNFVEGDIIDISIQIKAFPSDVTSRINVRFNESTSINFAQGSSVLTYIYNEGSARYAHYTKLLCQIIGTEIQGQVFNQYKSALTPSYSNSSSSFATISASLSSITSIQLISSTGGVNIPAGAIIIIKKK